MTTQTSEQDDGQRYRYDHLALPTVLRDMYYSKGDPGPGDLPGYQDGEHRLHRRRVLDVYLQLLAGEPAPGEEGRTG